MKTQKITIRRYRPADVQELANMYYFTIHKVNIQHYTQEQVAVWAPKTSLSTEKWEKKFERTNPFVAIVGEHIVGFAEFEPDGHIDCFYTHHNWIKKGVGSALMNAIYKEATHKGISRIFAEVSITAKPFFEKHGFSTVKEQTVSKNGVKLVNYKMEKLIDSR